MLPLRIKADICLSFFSPSFFESSVKGHVRPLEHICIFVELLMLLAYL